MISWMQKNHKYMNVAMWIAVISFIGAGGIAGWDAFSSTANASAKVGDVVVSSKKLAREESNLYAQYQQRYGESFDRDKAKEIGLRQMAMKNLTDEAQILNLAKKYGISATTGEIVSSIENIDAFKTDGKFDMKIYQAFLKGRNMKASEFEEQISDGIVISKFIKYLTVDEFKNETNSSGLLATVYDKIKYRVIEIDKNINPTEKELEKYWKENKASYLSNKKYKLDILWTDLANVDINDTEIEAYYKENNFKYKDKDGKVAELNTVREKIAQELKIKKGKKLALKERVSFKKDKLKATQTIVLDIGDKTLTPLLWNKIIKAQLGETLKPNVVGLKYATVKVLEAIEPAELSFDKAKNTVKANYVNQKAKELANTKAQNVLSNIDKEKMTTSDWLSMGQTEIIGSLSKPESLQFLQKLFTSSAKNDIIPLDKVLIVYRIVDQKIEDTPSNINIKAIKQRSLINSLVNELNKKNPVQNF